MQTVSVENKILSLPVLVPSISSFETQLDPLPALQLQQALREPVSLVSAYDLRRGGNKLIDLCNEYKKTAVLLLDSGGYEHSHVKRYAGNKAPPWTFQDFKEVCDLNAHDFVFSYDYFWRDEPHANETVSDFELRLLGEYFSSHNFVRPEKLIPVLHLQNRLGDAQLTEAQTLELVSRLASETKSPFLAIPERELGEGLIERFELAKKICNQIAQSNPLVSLHVLGCGNPLSFAFMCVAGAKMADGLEWYRTFTDESFHLHHFQHEPLYKSAGTSIKNSTAEFFMSLDVPYRVKVATSNLMSLQAFTASLAARLKDRTVHKLVDDAFGKKAGSVLRAVES